MIAWIAVNTTPEGDIPRDVSLLVRTITVGPVYDVAVFLGRDKAGALRWLMGDITLPHAAITHWARIDEPGAVEDA